MDCSSKLELDKRYKLELPFEALHFVTKSIDERAEKMKVLAINVSRNTGISTKKDPKGKAYDMASLQVLTPFEGGSGSKPDGISTWSRRGYGMQVTEFPCRSDCIDQFKDVRFPAQIEVATDTDIVFGRMTTVVTGLSVAPAAKAA